jgi:anti-anti-sigma factor
MALDGRNDLARVQFSRDADTCMVMISGEIDISNSSSIRGELIPHLRDVNRVIIDLSETTFLDSSAIALLLDIANSLNVTRRQLRVVIPDGAPIRRIVTLSGLDKEISIVTVRSEATGGQ